MTKLFRYQKLGVACIENFGGRALLADSMGLGKSIQFLTWMKMRKDVKQAIIICPSSVKWHWEHEAQIHIGARVQILEGRRVPNRTQLTRTPIVIINYDILKSWLPWLLSLKPDVICIDECHYIKNLRAQRTKLVRELCKNTPYVIALSGTPLTSRPSELWPTLNILRPDLFPSFIKYARRYCAPRWEPWGWNYNGASHLKELHTNLRNSLMIRRQKKDVLKDLPPKSRFIIPISIRNRHEYDKAFNDFISWLITNYGINKAIKAKKAESLIKIGYLKRLAARLKFRSVIEWIENFLQETDEKLVIFAIHKAAIKTLHRKFPSSVIVDGSVTGKKRALAVEQFQKDKNTRLFIGNIQAAGIGITLTASSTVLFAEMAWTPGEHLQAEDRIHRIGQRHPASVYYLVAHNTIEEKLCKILQKKQRVIEASLDGSRAAYDLNVFDQLIKAVRKG